jgi:CubicO group peptidase (beta-lactamase class C family)
MHVGARLLLGSLLVGVAGCRLPPDAGSAAGGAPPVPTCPAAGDTAVTAVLRPIREQHGVPALAAAAVTPQGLRYVGAVGVRKWGTETPVEVGDLWHIGSDTKAMTAALAARLVERGALSWQTTPAQVFPELAAEFQPELGQVTLLHLLSHRAGLQANLDWGRLAGQGTVQEQRLEAVREGLSRRPESKPGEAFLYSNLGYVVVGAMIERVAGKPWEDAITAEVFQPLGMRSVGFGGLGTPGQLDQPWGHSRRGHPVDTNGPDVDNPPVLGPAGRVHCTLQDWGRFIADVLRGLRGEQPTLLGPASYRLVLTPAFGGDYSLGWSVTQRSWGGGTVLNHCGCNTMHYANAWVAPQRGFAILVCTNQGEDAFPATDEAVAGLIPLATAATAEPAR